MSLRDRFQVASFDTFYKTAFDNGVEKDEAFVKAIVASCDDATDALLKLWPCAAKFWDLSNKIRVQWAKDDLRVKEFEMAKVKKPRKGDCGGTPINGKVGDVKPTGGRRPRRANQRK